MAWYIYEPFFFLIQVKLSQVDSCMLRGCRKEGVSCEVQHPPTESIGL